MRRFLIASAGLLVLVAATSPSGAAMRDHSFEVGGYLFGANFDNDSNIKNTGGLGARFGWAFTAPHELEFSIDALSTEDDFDGTLDVDLTTFKAGYVFNIMPEAQIVPFITVGLGFQNIRISDNTEFGRVYFDDQSDPLLFAGGGARFFVGPVFNIRLDGQAVAVYPDGNGADRLVDGIFSVGASWVLGGF